MNVIKEENKQQEGGEKTTGPCFKILPKMA